MGAWGSRAVAAVVASLAVALLEVACGSSPEGDCEAYMAAVCERTLTCWPGRAQSIGFDDVDLCSERQALLCPTLLSLQNTHLATGSLGVCASDVANAACSDWLVDFDSASCDGALTGELPKGAACVDDVQCASGLCSGQQFGCGVCLGPLGAEGQCAFFGRSCARGLVCASSGKCEAPRGLGAACLLTLDCVPNLACIDQVCAPAFALGATCSPSSPVGDSCNRADFDKCVDGTCGRTLGRGIGGQCMSAADCGPGLQCQANGSTCEPRFADGAICNPDDPADDPCTPPARCVSVPNGGLPTCQVAPTCGGHFGP